MGLITIFTMPFVIAAGGLLILCVAALARLVRRFAGHGAEAEALRPGTTLFGGSFLIALLCSALNGYLYFIDNAILFLLHPGQTNALMDMQILCFVNVVGFAISMYLFKAGRSRTE